MTHYQSHQHIFPAWLPHYVMGFKSDVERISVSGNLKFTTFDFRT